MADQYSVKVETDSSGNKIYFGRAEPGKATSAPYWSIMKCTYDATNTLTSALWADGNSAFDNVWDNRANLSYS